MVMLESRQMQLRPSLKFVMLSYMFCILLAVAMGVYMGYAKPLPPHIEWMFLVPAILFFFTFVRHMKKRLVKVTIMGDRLKYEAGLFSKTTRTIELTKVQDVRVQQSFGQRLVKLGDLSLETAGGTSRIEIDSIDNPQEAAEHILGLAQAQRIRPEAGPDPGAGVH
jgi:membrane protein YdbS with pleckstrin-like domain